MRVTITQARLSGAIPAIASKSMAHRLLIGAALADTPTDIVLSTSSEDIEATIGCLRALGAGIDAVRDTLRVTPLVRDEIPGERILDCHESGSTLRFLLPVVAALGVDALVVTRGRLFDRPLSPLAEELEAHGARIRKNADRTISVSGRLLDPHFRIAADISSQFVSGLLFAIPLMGREGSVTLSGEIESRAYIDMTRDALGHYGVTASPRAPVICVSGSYVSPGRVTVEGDWSCAAFWLVAGRLTDGAVTVTGLVPPGRPEVGVHPRRPTLPPAMSPQAHPLPGRPEVGACSEGPASGRPSLQGDSAAPRLIEEIARGGAVIDCSETPDLVPVLAVLAALSPGETVFTHAARLRLKESDRLAATATMLRALGGQASETDDGLKVTGVRAFCGGSIDSCRDHRIAMSAAIASIRSEGAVVIEGAEAVQKSYPGFWEDFRRLGAVFTEEG